MLTKLTCQKEGGCLENADIWLTKGGGRGQGNADIDRQRGEWGSGPPIFG